MFNSIVDIHVNAELYDPAQDIGLSKPIRNGSFFGGIQMIPMTTDLANHLNKKLNNKPIYIKRCN